MIRKSKRKLGKSVGGRDIKSEIRSYMKKVKVELFGYEKIVTESVGKFIEGEAVQLQVLSNQVSVNITQPNATIRVFLHANGQMQRELTMYELITFFVGSETASFPQVVVKVTTGIKAFITDYTSRRSIDSSELLVCIKFTNDRIVVQSFSQTGLIEELPVSDLIDFFNK
ncbi:MAG: hypothetical protein JXQ90_18200 [Cyclobacteriaceae bacterium]